MKRVLPAAALVFSQFACAVPPAPPAAQPDALLKPAVEQGPNWTRGTRAQFYSGDQGSRIIPLRWIMALKQANGQPFMADNLSRYGYLRNDEAPSSLPVGFTTNGPDGNAAIGMTCAACHTREIEVGGKPYRIDGGPAIADFQSFLMDIDQAVNKVLSDPAVFADFAAAVLGGEPSPDAARLLRIAISTWYGPYHTIMAGSLPNPGWGPARLDAVGMIFNRLAGLDIGPAAENYIIAANISRADTPVRYPFLWNSGIQDATQWPGFAVNGNELFALARNTGEVLGVFAQFHPKTDPTKIGFGIDYSSDNSSNTEGLMKLSDLANNIGPPKFQWAYDAALAERGKTIYQWPTAQGGCADCHGIKTSIDRLTGNVTWRTPILDVGTDTREYELLKRQVTTGVLSGAGIPFLGKPLKPTDTAFNLLKVVVVGTILQRLETVDRLVMANDEGSIPALLSPASLHRRAEALVNGFHLATDSGNANAYEARVLQGIWAVAPYLHNGSVPTLADLLNPAMERPKAFKIGPAYDPTGKVGLAVEQTRFDYTLTTTGCENRGSGASVCGHEYGTSLAPENKRALLEYLKTL